MEDSREDHWRDISEDGGDKSKIHDFRWYVYTRDKEEFIKRKFLVPVTHPGGGELFGLV